jgi:hypothetical protein
VHVGRDGHRPVASCEPVEPHPEVVERREAAPPELLGDGCGEEAALLHGFERFPGERSGAVVLVGPDRDLGGVLLGEVDEPPPRIGEGRECERGVHGENPTRDGLAQAILGSVASASMS